MPTQKYFTFKTSNIQILDKLPFNILVEGQRFETDFSYHNNGNHIQDNDKQRIQKSQFNY